MYRTWGKMIEVACAPTVRCTSTEPVEQHGRITTHTPLRTLDNSPAKRTTSRHSRECQACGNIERRPCLHRTTRTIPNSHRKKKGRDTLPGHSHKGIAPCPGVATATPAQTWVKFRYPTPTSRTKVTLPTPRHGAQSPWVSDTVV